MSVKKGNMYLDSKKQWNVVVGCEYQCTYCINSFQRQMKRQKWNCKVMNREGLSKCYTYEPHFHPERLHQSLPRTKGDEFIWCCSSGDITFAEEEWIDKIIKRIKELPGKTFFFQTKDPSCFYKYDFPDNVILGITLESNRDYLITKAPFPLQRYKDFSKLDFKRKIVIIEPIMQFDLEIFVEWIKNIDPMRVYMGYDTKKSNLTEPKLSQFLELWSELNKFTKVKSKLIREGNQYLKYYKGGLP